MHLLAVTSTACLVRPAQGRASRCQDVLQPAWKPAPRRWQRAAVAAAGGSDPPAASKEEESEGLLPEEDVQIPGTYRDAMTTNTPLGKAVKGACDELDTLGELERRTLEEAEDLLKQLGFKGSLFAAAPPPPPPQQQQGSEHDAA